MITIAIVACLGRSVCIIHRLCGGIRSASAALAQPAQTRGSSSPPGNFHGECTSGFGFSYKVHRNK